MSPRDDQHPDRRTDSPTSGRRAAVEAASRCYLAGEPLDMSALAAELGIGRATLYRWVGNREELLATVLSLATERTFRRAEAEAQGTGADLVLDAMRRFMHAVMDAAPLKALTKREPVLFIRLALLPGAIEDSAARVIAELLDKEATAGRLDLPLPTAVLAQAIVRLCDAHLYAQLLGRSEPEIDTALELVAMLFGTHHKTPQGR